MRVTRTHKPLAASNLFAVRHHHTDTQMTVPEKRIYAGRLRHNDDHVTPILTRRFRAAARSGYRHDLVGAINAHMTNTPQQMADALASNATWLEGDIRLVAGRPRMAHLPVDAPFGMDAETWLRIAAASGRSIKMDFKDPATIEPVIALIRKLGIESHRLMFNITVSGRRIGNVSASQAKFIRRRFQDAVIAISADDASYPPALLRDLGRMARSLGGTTQVMVRWDLIGPRSISLLQQYTNVGIWNEPIVASPRDIPAEVTRLRSLGVTGVIDLR